MAPSLAVLAIVTLLPSLYLLATSFTPLNLARPETQWDFSEPLVSYRQLLQRLKGETLTGETDSLTDGSIALHDRLYSVLRLIAVGGAFQRPLSDGKDVARLGVSAACSQRLRKQLRQGHHDRLCLLEREFEGNRVSGLIDEIKTYRFAALYDGACGQAAAQDLPVHRNSMGHLTN